MDKAVRVARRNCMLTLACALIVLVCVCVGVTMNLTTIYDENFDHMGIRTFCMFTVNSNILCAIGMSLLISYCVDGLRKHNFHVPKWAMVIVFAGVTSVTLTFLVSLFILAPVKGFVLIFTGSRFFLHGLCPILAIVSFCFFMSEQKLLFLSSLLAMVPVMIYSFLYIMMVAVIGEERGGWNDFYGFIERFPIWILIVAIIPLTLLIATVLRILHNRSYDRRIKMEAEYFNKIFKDADIHEIVSAMAWLQKSVSKGKDIVVPGRVISVMVENNNGNVTWEECCQIYLKEYLSRSQAQDLTKLWI